MKKDIHPTYHKAKVVCTSCGAEFETGSVLSEIEKFNKKYGMK